MSHEDHTSASFFRPDSRDERKRKNESVLDSRTAFTWLAKPVTVLLTLSVACGTLTPAHATPADETVAAAAGTVSGDSGLADLPAASEPAGETANDAGGAPVTEVPAAEPVPVAPDETLAEHTATGGETQADTYQVTFHSEGGSEVPAATVAAGTAVTRPAPPVRPGYVFTHWLKKTPRGNLVQYGFHLPVTGDLQLYAGWKLATYSVSFDANGGEGTPLSIDVKHGQSIEEPVLVPVRAGHVFTGWHLRDEQGELTAYEFGSEITGSLTLVAGWQIITHRVTFDTRGGTPVPAAQDVEYDDAAERPETDPVKPNHEFTGWYVRDWHGGLRPYEFDEEVLDDLTVYAGWEREECGVLFDTDGGTEIADTRVKCGTTLPKPKNPVKPGHTFTGWFLEQNDGSLAPYNFDTVIEENMILVAGWQVKSYRVTFDTDGGTQVPAQTVEYGLPVDEPEQDPVKPGHLFTGWYVRNNHGELSPYDFYEPVEGRLTIVAGWEAEEYQVVFYDADGVTRIAETTAKYGSQLTAPNKPVKPGHKFTGWYVKNDAGELVAYDFTTAVQDNLAITAGWEVRSYQVRFDPQGGSQAPAPQSVNYGDPVAEPATAPVKPGHTFTGWFTKDHTGKLSAYDFDEPVGGYLTLIAGWQIDNYQVMFDADGGSPTPEPQSVEYRAPAERPEVVPVKPGHTFTGWYLKGDDGELNLYEFDEEVDGDFTLVAGWQIDSYTVTFDTDGGTPMSAQGVEYGSLLARPEVVPVKPGHTFTGWYLKGDDGELNLYEFDEEVDGDFTLVAGWQIDSYTVTFDTDGGTPTPPAQAVAGGEPAKQPTTEPKKPGYVFDGWYLKDSDGNLTPYEFDKSVESDLTIVAQWNVNAHTVTFDTDGGTPIPPAQSVEQGQTAEQPLTHPKKPGYVFAGWYLQRSDGKQTKYRFSTPVQADIKLVATWKTASYQVTFDVDGGTPTPVAQTVEHQQQVTEPTIIPTKPGHVFTGWYTKNAAGEPVKYDFTRPVTEQITLIAGWQQGGHQVLFDLDGGSPELPAQTVAGGGLLVKPATVPTKEGYKFIDWYVKNENNVLTKYSFDNPVTTDLTLIARWKAVKHQVTFDMQGGMVMPKKSVLHGNKLPRLATPRKNGSHFLGWQLRVDGKLVPYDLNTPVTTDLELVALWSANTHQLKFDTQGGQTIEPVTVNRGHAIKMPKTPTKEGYKFVAWYKKNSIGKLLRYRINAPVYEDLVLIAVWRSDKHTVTFDTRGGIRVMPQIVADGKPLKMPRNPMRKGYVFINWLLQNEAGELMPYSFDTPITDDVQLIANWKKK